MWLARRDAGLSPADEGELAAWLAADPAHRAAFARYADAWATLDRPRAAGGAAAVMEELERRRWRRRRRRAAWSGVGLAAALAAGLWWRPAPAARPAAPVPASVAAVSLPARQLLSDGSVVELKDGAEIAVDYREDVRRVVLRRGEAHFQVAKNPRRPFLVEAGGIEVRAVGTAFSVQLGRRQIEVIVTEGRVAVEKTDAMPGASPAPPQPLAVLDRGERLVVDAEPAVEPGAASAVDPGVQPIAAAEVDARLAWRRPRLEFSATPLAEAVALLNRHATGEPRVRFVVDDPALADVRVSGYFRADNSDAFVHLLEASFGVRAERRPDGEIVLRKAP